MKTYRYKCTLLADTVITSKPGTQGSHNSLDYIPGSNFLGLVAGHLYSEAEAEKTLDLFHNGTVRYGNAYPYLQGEKSRPFPFSINLIKGASIDDDGRSIYLHHNLVDQGIEYIESIIENKGQIKQHRVGYFTSQYSYRPKQGFSLKSAFNSQERRPKEGYMFGYYGLKKGQVFAFDISSSNTGYLEEIKGCLDGTKHRIGRSKSAEYGLVHIDLIETFDSPSGENIPQGEMLVYAESDWCLYDKYGRTTLEPQPNHFGLNRDDVEIVWEKCQIKGRLHQSWNGARKNKNADRSVISKGSVIVIKLKRPVDSTSIVNGVGSHLSEGFGDALVNPDFLFPDKIKNYPFTKFKFEENETPSGEMELKGNDASVFKYLKQKKETADKHRHEEKEILAFTRNAARYQGVTRSQWGQVRDICRQAVDKKDLVAMLFSQDKMEGRKNHAEGFFYRGKSANVWKKNGRIDQLEKFIEQLDDEAPWVVMKLAAEMARKSK